MPWACAYLASEKKRRRKHTHTGNFFFLSFFLPMNESPVLFLSSAPPIVPTFLASVKWDQISWANWDDVFDEDFDADGDLGVVPKLYVTDSGSGDVELAYQGHIQRATLVSEVTFFFSLTYYFFFFFPFFFFSFLC